MLSNKSIILFALLIAATALSAWSITDSYFGNRFGTLDARIYSMGGAGTYNDARPFGIADNPANLTLQKKLFGMSVNTYINRNEDNRSIPLYNSFDNYVDDAVYSSNINVFNNLAAAGFLSYSIMDYSLGFGAFHKPLLSFDSDYVEEVRDNGNTDNDGYPRKIAQNSIVGRGSLNQTGVAASAAMDLGDDLMANFGISFAMLNGDITNEKSIRWTDEAKTKFANFLASNNLPSTYNLPDMVEKSDYELSGNQIKAGFAVRLNSRLGIAATHSLKSTLTKEGSYHYKRDAYRNTAVDTVNTKIKEDYILPSETRLGFSYMPRNIMRTVFNLDLEYVTHSDICDHYEDVVNLYAGVEHHVTNRIPMRLGFQAVTNYFFYTEAGLDADNNPITLYNVRKILNPTITAGSSINLMKNLTADLGFAYTWREYEAMDMFGDAYYNDKTYTGSSSYALWPNSYIALANRGWENPDKVRENNISLNAGISYSW